MRCLADGEADTGRGSRCGRVADGRGPVWGEGWQWDGIGIWVRGPWYWAGGCVYTGGA